MERWLDGARREIDAIVTDETASPGVDPAARERLVATLPRVHELIDRLAAGPVPETLVHGDFHPWNAQRDGDRLVIFDWSDACWGHPFFDVPTVTNRTDDATARESLRETVVTAWSAFGDRGSIREALAWSEPLTELHLSITWRRLQGMFEEDGAYPFVDSGVQRHLEQALAAIDALSTGAG
jgi:Ser/Thr protein kinase RdoA (MazF antagonist)